MKVLIVGVIVALTVGACQSGNLTRLKDDELFARTTTANEARMTPEGNLQASYQGIGATQAMVEPNNYWIQQQGPAAVMNFPIAGGVAQMYSPKNIDIGSLTYTPKPPAGQPMLTITNLRANISEPMAQDVEGLRAAYPELVILNRDAVNADIERMKAAGEITSDLATAIVGLLSKWAPVVPIP